MYFETYLRNKNDNNNHSHQTHHITPPYQPAPLFHNIKPTHNHMPSHNHTHTSELNTDHLRHVPPQMPVRNQYRTVNISTVSPKSQHTINIPNRFQQTNNSNLVYFPNKPLMGEERRFVNPSPGKHYNRASTSVGRQQNTFCRYDRKSQSTALNQPKFPEPFKFNPVNSHSNNTGNQQPYQYEPSSYKNTIPQNHNIKFTPSTPNPPPFQNTFEQSYVTRKSSNVSNDLSTQAITINQQQHSEITPIKNDSYLKGIKNAQNISLQKLQSPCLYNNNNTTDRKGEVSQVQDRNNQFPNNTFYEYKKKQVQKLNSMKFLQQDHSLQPKIQNYPEKATSISFYEYKKKQESKLNKMKSIRQFTQLQSQQASTLDSHLQCDIQALKLQSKISQQISNQEMLKSNYLNGLTFDKGSRGNKSQQKGQNGELKIKMVQLQLELKIKQLHEKTKEIADKNRQLIQKNKQIESLSIELKQFKENKDKLSSNLEHIKGKQRENQQLTKEKQLLATISHKQVENTKQAHKINMITQQLSEQSAQINELINSLSKANTLNQQLTIHLQKKQKQTKETSLLMHQNERKLRQMQKKVAKLQECEHVINHLSTKIKQYQRTINEYKGKNSDKTKIINELHTKVNKDNELMHQMTDIQMKQQERIKNQMQRQIEQSQEVIQTLNQQINTKSQSILALNTALTDKNTAINHLNMTLLENNNGIIDMNAKISQLMAVINFMKEQKRYIQGQKSLVMIKLKQKQDRLKQQDEVIQMKNKKIKEYMLMIQNENSRVTSLLAARMNSLTKSFQFQYNIVQTQTNKPQDIQQAEQAPQILDQFIQNHERPASKPEASIQQSQVLQQKGVQDRQVQVQMKQDVGLIGKAAYDLLQRRFQQLSRQLKKVVVRLSVSTLQWQQMSKLNTHLSQQIVEINLINLNEKYRQLQIPEQ